MNTKAFVLLPLIASLAACGGGDGTAPGSSGTVSLMVTDNLTQDYSEVWVNIKSITAADASNQSVTLYEDATGQAVNLSQLVNVGALVNTQAVPAGSYTSFQITLGNAIDLVDQGGTITHAAFDPAKGVDQTFTISVTGALTVDANQATTLVLDFDLAQFTYNASTNTVTPVVVQKDPNTLNQVTSTVYGEIERIISATEFVIDPKGDGRNLTVKLHSSAAVTNAATGAVTADTSGLRSDMYVSVSGTYDAATLTITASSVTSVMKGSSSVGVYHEVEGTISAINGTVVTIDVHEANFMPGANSLTIDVANAAFSHGTLTALAVGQKIEIKGGWDGTGFTAAVVEIDGCSRNGDDDSDRYDDEYAEIEGRITAIADGVVTVTVLKHENVEVPGFSASNPLMIDSSNSWFEDGTAACLVVGGKIEAKGGMTAVDAMSANVIEIESGCGGVSGSDDEEREGRESDRDDD